jgi:TPR repeat protein
MGGLRTLLSRLLLGLALLVAGLSAAGGAGNRVALLIGNGAYAHVPSLPNPTNDSEDMAAALERLGFAVKLVTDGTYLDLRKSLIEFGNQAQRADIALIFYAGHGISLKGENWLIPVDAELKSESDVTKEAISLKAMMDAVSRASTMGVVILDACRNNPFAAKMRSRDGQKRGIPRGLAPVQSTQNIVVAYASTVGTTADDGNERNSPFSSALIKHIETPGLEIGLMFRRVRDAVLAATKGEQQPFMNLSLPRTAVYFSPRTGTPQPASPTLSGSNISALVTDCDRLAASPVDDSRPAGIAGVEVEKIAVERATAACDEALRHYPSVARFALQAGRVADARKDHGRARKLYEAASELGNPVAMFNLGLSYDRGIGIAQDPAEARKWYERAAQRNLHMALLNLGFLYERGRGVSQDFSVARDLYEKSAARGNRRAMNNLGYFFEQGFGINTNYAEARRLYESSARLGDAVAMRNLGNLFEHGLGVTKNLDDARKWYEKAAIAGDEEAKKRLDSLK